MKLLNLLLLCVCMTGTAAAKMTSGADVSNIHKITVEDDKITIVGDCVFYSKMVTTEEGKDSKFVIGGQPSVNYTAKGFATRFVILPYAYDKQEQMSDNEKREWAKMQKMFKKIWADNLAAVKLLKVKGKVSLVFQESEVKFVRGEISFVQGYGLIQQARIKEGVAPKP